MAVKRVRVAKATELLSFLREVEALSSLRHPHVLPFLGACMAGAGGDADAGRHFWLLTEFMEQVRGSRMWQRLMHVATALITVGQAMG